MLKVTIELYPFGAEEAKRTLGEVFIWNDGTGTSKKGNYRFWWGAPGQFHRRETEPLGFLQGFPRQSRSSFELLRRCLEAVKKKLR